MHPNGLRRKLKEAPTIEEALDILLTASNEEKRLRSRIRKAATLEVALEALLEVNGCEFEDVDGPTTSSTETPKGESQATRYFDIAEELSEAGRESQEEGIANLAGHLASTSGMCDELEPNAGEHR